MKIKTKLIGTFMAVVTLISAGILTASAATTSVHLTTSQKIAYSSTAYGYYKYYSGSNSSSSARNVHFSAMYKKGGVWYTGSTCSMAPGGSFDEIKTKVLSKERTWQLKLNPDGANKTGCDAWGYLREV